MNRIGSIAGSPDLARGSMMAAGVIAGFALVLLAVVKLGLPIWALVPVIAAGVYLAVVLHFPTVGLIAVVCVFFLPLQVFGRLTLLQSVGVVTGGLLLIWFLYNQRTIFLGNVLLPLFLLGVLVLISFWFTLDSVRTTFYLRKWIFNMVFAMLLMNMVTNFDIFKKVVWTVMIMAALNAVVGVYDYATTSEVHYRSMGLLENANAFGQLAALAFPLALYQYLYRRGVMRWLGLGIAAVLVGGIVVSVSRGATVAVVLVFAVIVVTERRRIVPLMIVLCLALCVVPFLPHYFQDRVGDLAGDVKRSVLVSDNTNLTSRGYLNRAGLMMWKSHPVFGVGVGNFGYYFVEKEFNTGMRLAAHNRIVAHNIYMQALAEMGLLGLTVLAWLILVTLRNIITARRVNRLNRERWMYFGAIEMMALAILVGTASGGDVLKNEYWLFVSLTAVSSRVALTDLPETLPDEA